MGGGGGGGWGASVRFVPETSNACSYACCDLTEVHLQLKVEITGSSCHGWFHPECKCDVYMCVCVVI